MLGSVLLLACALRSVQYFARPSFWFDELAIALNIEARSFADLITRPLDYSQVAPAGFLAAVKASSFLLGVTEIGLRLFPWICSIAAVFLFWRVCRRVLSGGPLLAALLLFAASPSLTWYAGQVKPYSADVAATLLLVLCALRFLEHPQDRRAALVGGLCGGLAVLASFPAVVTAAVLGAILLWHCWRHRSQASVASLISLCALWGAGCLISGMLALNQLDPETQAYMRRFWVDGFVPVPWKGMAAALWIPNQLYGSLGFLLLFVAANWTAGRVFVSLCAVLACVGLITLFRKTPWQAALIIAPSIAAIAAAAVHLLPFRGRVGLYAGWPLVILAVAGLEQIRDWLPARARVAAVAFMTLVAAAPAALVLFAGRPPYHTEEARPVLSALASRWQSGDKLYVYFGARHAMKFYGPRLGFHEWFTGECHRGDPRAYFQEADQFRGQPRVWFFYTHPSPGYREPEVIRSYLTAIGAEREVIADPFEDRGELETAAYLFDLSDTQRLSAATPQSHQFPAVETGRPRVLCDGTRVGRDR